VTAWHRAVIVMARLDRATCINTMERAMSRAMTTVGMGVNGLKRLKLARMRLGRATGIDTMLGAMARSRRVSARKSFP